MAKQRERLGRGLGALLGDYLPDESGRPAGAQKMVAVASVAPNPFQPRREFAEAELADLVASIRENGLLQPIVVRPAVVERGAVRYELVAGERRWRAVTRLGWKDVPAVVRPVDDRTLLVLALVENLQRSQLSAIEEADAYRRLAEEFTLSQQDIAEVVGKDRSTVANALRLLQLPVAVRQMVAEGRLGAGHARALLGLGNDRRIADLATEAVEQGWSVREVEARVQRVRPAAGRRPRKERGPRDASERVLEEALQQVLGTNARIRRGRGMRGRIEIPFYGAEDFERVFELIARRSASDLLS
jgi:ParB family chromosome partitioning protein